MNARKLFVLILLANACLIGIGLFISYQRYGLTGPVCMGYALLFCHALLAGAYAGQIKRWMK